MRSLRILITAGPTREKIDPVRFISNRSSGKMGYAIAEAASKLKNKVTLISGPVTLPLPIGVKLIVVESAEEMFTEVKKYSNQSDVIIMAAAVADYRPAKPSKSKIKKSSKTMTLRLERTTDILKRLGTKKKPNQFLVGFAAETDELLKNARDKMRKKKVDLLIANLVGKKGSGFEVDENKVTLLDKSGSVVHWSKMKKKELGLKLVKLIIQKRNLDVKSKVT